MRHFKAMLVFSGLAAAIAFGSVARADEQSAPASAPTITQPAPKPHANPRFKASFRMFQIRNLDGTAVPLKGAQLDAYPISRRWVRLGLEAEAGAGDASLDGNNARLWYAMGGLTLGLQYPSRVTPFVEGRIAAGALGGVVSGTNTTTGGATVQLNNVSGTTIMYTGGIDAGIELYTFGRFFLSAAIGWAHPVYEGVDYAAMKSNPNGGMQLKAVADDTFTFKLGIGI